VERQGVASKITNGACGDLARPDDRQVSTDAFSTVCWVRVVTEDPSASGSHRQEVRATLIPSASLSPALFCHPSSFSLSPLSVRSLPGLCHRPICHHPLLFSFPLSRPVCSAAHLLGRPQSLSVSDNSHITSPAFSFRPAVTTGQCSALLSLPAFGFVPGRPPRVTLHTYSPTL